MLNGNDLELLSAYLDEALSASERADLEARLQADANLRREFERLQATKALIASLPTLTPPRDLRLTRAMVGVSRRRQRVLTSPLFSGLSAAAAVILLVIGARLFTLTGQQAEPNAAAFSQVVALPTGIAPQPQVGMLDELQAATALDTQQFGAAQAEIAPEALLTEPDSAANDQFMAAPAEAPAGAADMAPALAALPSASPTNETGVLRFAVAPTPSAAESGGGGAVSDAQLRSGDQTDMANSGLAASAPLPQATLNPPVMTASPLPSPTAKPSATPTLAPSLAPAPTEPLSAKSAPAANAATVGIGLMVVAVLLFGAAVVTTVLRRRG